MKRLLRWTSLLLVVLTLNSCGLPGALVRTVNNGLRGLSSLGSSST
jgi:hypothetical protein